MENSVTAFDFILMMSNRAPVLETWGQLNDSDREIAQYSDGKDWFWNCGSNTQSVTWMSSKLI